MAGIPEEPRLDLQTLAEIRKGVEEFNSARFFECHDTLEEVWRGMRGPARSFLQGLIQLSVGFYHLSHGNLIGGEGQPMKALKNLEPYGGSCRGFELADLRLEVQNWLERIRRREGLWVTSADFPKLRFSLPDCENGTVHERR